jgi:hypothetical protein
MKKLWLLLLIIPIFVLGCLLLGNNKPSPQSGKAVLKDGREVIGVVGEKEYGKFVIIKTDDNNQQVITWDQLQYIHEPQEAWCWSFLVALWGSLAQLAVAAGLIGFFIGLWQYGDAQKWKRNEFIVKEIGVYEDNQYVSNAQSVLDANGELVELLPANASGVTPSLVVDSNTLARVLAPPDAASPFSDAEKRIRESFDVFLSNLERFNNFIDSDLVKKKEIELYLSYWLKIMGDSNNTKITPEARAQLWAYIEANDYPGVIRLLNKFNYRAPQP